MLLNKYIRIISITLLLVFVAACSNSSQKSNYFDSLISSDSANAEDSEIQWVPLSLSNVSGLNLTVEATHLIVKLVCDGDESEAKEFEIQNGHKIGVFKGLENCSVILHSFIVDGILYEPSEPFKNADEGEIAVFTGGEKDIQLTVKKQLSKIIKNDDEIIYIASLIEVTAVDVDLGDDDDDDDDDDDAPGQHPNTPGQSPKQSPKQSPAQKGGN
jgi:hypothetical protein